MRVVSRSVSFSYNLPVFSSIMLCFTVSKSEPFAYYKCMGSFNIIFLWGGKGFVINCHSLQWVSSSVQYLWKSCYLLCFLYNCLMLYFKIQVNSSETIPIFNAVCQMWFCWREFPHFCIPLCGWEADAPLRRITRWTGVEGEALTALLPLVIVEIRMANGIFPPLHCDWKNPGLDNLVK